MKKEKQTEITVETETVLVVRKRDGAGRGRCEACGAEVALLTPLTAARLLRVSTRLVYAGIEAGLVHFAESPDGTLLVCGPSAWAVKHYSEGAATDTRTTTSDAPQQPPTEKE